MASQLIQRLGRSAVTANGRWFTEANHAVQSARLRDELADAVSIFGAAQLVFDNYDYALKPSHGARLQANLGRLLVDSPEARDIGSVLFARTEATIHLQVRGSPLISRFERLAMPRWQLQDLEDVQEAEAEKAIGESASLLARTTSSGRLFVSDLARQLALEGDTLLDHLPAQLVSAISGAGPFLEDHPASLGLITRSGAPTDVTVLAGLPELALQRGTGWPSDLASAARAFARLLDGCNWALWTDRYLFKDVARLAEFLVRVRSVSDVRIALLGSRKPGNLLVSKESLRSSVGLIPNVDYRFMTPVDFRGLHDRHLFARGHLGGWVLPTADVMLGAAPRGSAVVTRAHRFGVDYEDIWQRSLTE